MRSATPIAIGVVTLLGASDISDSRLPPSSAPMPQADNAAVSEPATSAISSGPAIDFSRGHCAWSGIASATVAGPSRKCTNCAPSK